MPQDRNLSAALSTGARQLSAPGAVAQPDIEGQQAQFDYSAALVGQLTQFGEAMSTKKMQDRADVMRTEGAIAVSQGKSLQELRESDRGSALSVFGETATMQGAHAQQALIQMDDFKAELVREVDENNGDQMTPAQYREYAAARYAEALEAIPEGTSGRDLMASMGQKVLAETAAYQAEKNFAYRQNAQLEAYTASVYSVTTAMKEAKEGGKATLYKQAMADLEARLEQPPGMKDSAYSSVLTGVATEALRFGDRAVYDMVLKKGVTFSPEERNALENGLESFKQREAEKGSLQQAGALAKIQEAAANGAGSEAIANMVAQYNATYQRTPITVNQSASLFNQAASTRQVRAQQAEAIAAQRQLLAQSQDYRNTKKDGEKTLQAYMAEKPGSEEAKQAWAQSSWHNPQMVSQYNAMLNPATMIDAAGNINPAAIQAVREIDAWAQINPTKAVDMLKGDAQTAYRAVQQLVASNQPLEQAVAAVATGYQNKDNQLPVSPDEAKAVFEEEDFGMTRAADYLPFTGMEDKELTGIRGFAQNRYSEYRKLGMSEYDAQQLAIGEVKNRTTRMGDKVVDTKGINVQRAFGAADADDIVTNIDAYFRRNPQVATQLVGSAVGTAAKIQGVEFIKPARGVPEGIVISIQDPNNPEGTQRRLRLNSDVVRQIMATQPATAEQIDVQMERAQLTKRLAEQQQQPYSYGTTNPNQ